LPKASSLESEGWGSNPGTSRATFDPDLPKTKNIPSHSVPLITVFAKTYTLKRFFKKSCYYKKVLFCDSSIKSDLT